MASFGTSLWQEDRGWGGCKGEDTEVSEASGKLFTLFWAVSSVDTTRSEKVNVAFE